MQEAEAAGGAKEKGERRQGERGAWVLMSAEEAAEMAATEVEMPEMLAPAELQSLLQVSMVAFTLW